MIILSNKKDYIQMILLPKFRHKTMKKNNMIKSTKKKETMKKIRSKKNDLLNYFNCDHKDLSKEYLKSCNDFFKSIDQKNKYNYGLLGLKVPQ